MIGLLVDHSAVSREGKLIPLATVVDGSMAGPDANGFVIVAGGSTIAGLVINRFAGSGIVLHGAGGNQVVSVGVGPGKAPHQVH